MNPCGQSENGFYNLAYKQDNLDLGVTKKFYACSCCYSW